MLTLGASIGAGAIDVSSVTGLSVTQVKAYANALEIQLTDARKRNGGPQYGMPSRMREKVNVRNELFEFWRKVKTDKEKAAGSTTDRRFRG